MDTLLFFTIINRVDHRRRKACSPSMTSSALKCISIMFFSRCSRGNMALWGRPLRQASPLRFHKTKAPIAIKSTTKLSLWLDFHCILVWNILVTMRQKVRATIHSWKTWFSVSTRPHCVHEADGATPHATRRSAVGKAPHSLSQFRSQTSEGRDVFV